MSEPGKKSGCGCIAKGCVVMVLLGVFFIGVLAWGGKKIVAMFRDHASSTPVEAEVGHATQAEYDALVKKLDDYQKAASASGRTLDLNAHDLNTLIAFSPDWAYMRGKVHASIDGDQIGLAGSLPLDFLGLRDLYWNGDIHFTVTLDDKGFHSTVQGIHLKGGDLTGEETKTVTMFWTAYMTNNLLPVVGPVLMKTKSLKVKDGVISLTSN